jgi:pimeloyl-ACP methyl ester carboxylesterase
MMVRVIVWLILALPIGVLLVLLAWSRPGRPTPYAGPGGRPLAGSLSEKLHVPINGVRQGMILQSRDVTRPVLLYLHGGMPDYFLTRRHPTGLDGLFTVCWWEQRGSGLSFDPTADPRLVSLDQLVSDTLAVTDYLRTRFGQGRIYLMGHSGGTFLGMHAVARSPERFHAYIGVAQMADQRRSEWVAYEHMLQAFRAAGNTRMVRRLEAAPVTPDDVPREYLAVRDDAMHRLGGGTMRAIRSVARGIFLESLKCPDYSLVDKVNLWRGKIASGVSSMWTAMLATRLASDIPRVAVPVYFVHGAHDLTCSIDVAREYLASLEAPCKAFYTFEDSAHSPLFEEPDRFCAILSEAVLMGRTTLADGSSADPAAVG